MNSVLQSLLHCKFFIKQLLSLKLQEDNATNEFKNLCKNIYNNNNILNSKFEINKILNKFTFRL